MPAEVDAATMSTQPHDENAPGHAGTVARHETDDHGDDHGHDDQAPGEEPLGPLDGAAWGAGLLGVVIALVIAFCFVLATAAPTPV
jgi:hypothetical protein